MLYTYVHLSAFRQWHWKWTWTRERQHRCGRTKLSWRWTLPCCIRIKAAMWPLWIITRPARVLWSISRMSPSCGKYKGGLSTAYAVAYTQYCNVFPFHCFMTHIPPRPQVYGLTCFIWLPIYSQRVVGWLKNSLQVRNKFIVFNLLSPALYAKCTWDTQRHMQMVLNMPTFGHGKCCFIFSHILVFYLLCSRGFLSHLLARIVGLNAA